MKYGTYTITIPASFADGEYIVRHEILGAFLIGLLFAMS